MHIRFSSKTRLMRRAEREGMEINRLLVESCPMFMEVWEDDVLTRVNGVVAQLLGVSCKEEYVERYKELSPELQPCGTNSMEKSAELIAQTKRDGHSRFEWVHINLATGEHIPFECNFTSLKLHNKSVVLGYCHDLRPLLASMEKERELETQMHAQMHKQEMMKKEHDAQERILREINKRERLLNVANQAANVLLTANEENSIEALMKSLGIIGRLFDVERTSIWQHEEIDGELRFPLRHEWLSELGKQKPRYPSGFAFRYADDPEFCDKILNGENFNNPVSEFSAGARAHYTKYGVLSAALLPMVLNGKIIGYFSLHDCKKERTFSKEEIDIMVSVGLMITSVYYKMAQSALKEAHERERRRTAIAEESNRAKSAFLARMSHEVRTPITAIMGIAEIELQNLSHSPHMEEMFNKIHNSSKQLLNIVNDVLDLSKIESGKVEVLSEEYDVANLIVDTAQTNTVYGSGKEIKFNISIDENLPARLIGDSAHIGQIMDNILSNAFKYTDRGTVDFSMRCQKDSDEYISLIITISDTGYGMSAEQLSDLGTEHTRFHERDFRHTGGTGLGMPIVFSLAQMMGAKINIESEVGEGTKVVVQIPQKIAGQAVLGKELAENLQRFEYIVKIAGKKSDFEPESMPYGSVLVVDDVDANLYVAKGLLAFYDLQIETCTNGFDALKLIEQGNVYDIIFLDHMMPGMNGTKVLRKMREAGYKHPVFVLTANAMIGRADEFIKRGFDGFISKPIDTKRLNDILVKYIKNKQPQEVIAEAEAASAKTREASIHDFQDSDEMLNSLRQKFVKSHSNQYTDICDALDAGDIKTAHRLAHSIKGVASLIKEFQLLTAAKCLEDVLNDGKMPSAQCLADFEREFTRVLEEIGTDTSPQEYAGEYLGIHESTALLDEAAALLKNRNSACLAMLDKLRMVKGASELCDKIDDFEFAEALEILAVLKAGLEQSGGLAE